MATKTPNTSAAASSRRRMPPPPGPAAALSPPFSPAPFRPRLGAAAVAGGCGAAAGSSFSVERPCVKLWEWWLARVEGEDRKLAVSGYTEKNEAFTSAPIAKRYEPLTLEDEDGVVLLLDGSMSLPRMLENEFSPLICESFLVGFPYWWETWDSYMETFPKCFINPQEDSSQFYLQKFQLGNFLEKLGPSFIENLLNDAKSNPFDDADTFTDCSRFEEYTCGSDFSTKEISAYSNDDIPAPVVDEVEETDLIAGSPSQQRDNADIQCNLSFGHTETGSGDETCEETGNENDTMHPDSIASSPSQQRDNVDIHCNLSFAPTETCSGDDTCKETGNQNDTMHPDLIASSPSQQRGNVDIHCNLSFAPTETCSGDETCKETGNHNDTMHPDLIASSPSQQRDNVDIHCDLSFGPTETCSGDEICKETGNQNDTMHPDLIASSHSQQRDNVDIHCDLSFGPTETCSGDETSKETGNQNDTMHPDARELEFINSNLILSRSLDCMPSDLEDRNNSAEDLVSKCLLAAVPPEKANFCSEISGTLQSVEPLSYQSTPESSLKNQACLKRTELITFSQEAVPNEDTSITVHVDVQPLETSVFPAEKQRSAQKLLRTPMSPRTRSPISYVHRVPFTRARAHSLSISTPESLNMKKTKSGRVVVPPLDPGSERIVYAMDGTTLGVSPVFQSPKGSSARKRKRKAL